MFQNHKIHTSFDNLALTLAPCQHLTKLTFFFETLEKFEQEELVSKRERVEVVLADYNQQRLECGKKVEDMWQVCNKCLTDKCVKHYAGKKYEFFTRK